MQVILFICHTTCVMLSCTSGIVALHLLTRPESSIVASPAQNYRWLWVMESLLLGYWPENSENTTSADCLSL